MQLKNPESMNRTWSFDPIKDWEILPIVKSLCAITPPRVVNLLRKSVLYSPFLNFTMCGTSHM